MDTVADIAAQLRVDAIRMSTAAGSGHPTSSMSAADLMAVLLTRHLRYQWDAPRSPGNDHLVFSKGHASPLLYAMYKAAGVIGEEDILTAYRRQGSTLSGHPTPSLPYVDVATGSLGQGLPDAVGIAMAGRLLERSAYRVWVLCGDGEMAEGSVWEALDHAGNLGLANLTVIVDVNRLGQRGPTSLGWDLRTYAERVRAFGATPLVVDGHDLDQIDAAYCAAAFLPTPTVVLARTVKGKGFAEVEDKVGWHGKPFSAELAGRAIASLGGVRNRVVRGPDPLAGTAVIDLTRLGTIPDTTAVLPTWPVGQEVATRQAFGEALVALGSHSDVVVLDADVGNSTMTDLFAAAYPERFFEQFIAEQQLVAAATGIATRGYSPFISTFAAFFTRAHDFLRQGAISQVAVRCIGSHAGVEIGADGPSQMGLEDLALFRSLSGSTVLYPADATSTADLVAQMRTMPGISYLRTTRGDYPVLYPAGERFPVGGSKVLRWSDFDEVTLIGAGVTTHACLAAADELMSGGTRVRVVDAYSVKPLDVVGITASVRATGGRVLVAEDHHPEGGLGEAVCAALASAGVPVVLRHLAVRAMPGSGTTQELLAAAGLSPGHIANAVRDVLQAVPAGV